jgi:uncharacterized protein (DUF1697 family)
MARVTRYVALLRGINVGGHNKVPMAGLRATCTAAGCTDVATYIQSGNVALTSPLSAAKLRATLEAAIAEELGVAPVVVIRSAEALAGVVAGNPFAGADPNHLHVAFLNEAPDPGQLAALTELDLAPDELASRAADVYFHLPNGLGRSKLIELFSRRVKTPATIRNWRTVNKMLEMVAT